MVLPRRNGRACRSAKSRRQVVDRLGFIRHRQSARRRFGRRTGDRERRASRAKPGPATSASASPKICTRSTSPAVDRFGNIYTTFSGSRGQKVPVAVYKIDLNYNDEAVHQRSDERDRLAFDDEGHALHLQPFRRHRVPGHAHRQHVCFRRRHGRRHRAWHSTTKATCTSATAAAPFSRSVPSRQIFVFATLEPSISAYHLAFGPDRYLYVTGPDYFELRLRVPHIA